MRCQQGSLGLVRSAVRVKEGMWKSYFKWAISNINLTGEFNFCVSMHHYIWVYWDQLDANCLVLFYYTFFLLYMFRM